MCIRGRVKLLTCCIRVFEGFIHVSNMLDKWSCVSLGGAVPLFILWLYSCVHVSVSVCLSVPRSVHPIFPSVGESVCQRVCHRVMTANTDMVLSCTACIITAYGSGFGLARKP